MIKGWIFDLDGVITDTAEFHYKAWKRLADEEGIPFTREDNEQLRGVSRAESLKLLLKGKEVSDEHFREMMDRKNGYYQESVEEMGPEHALPGAR
ncbi:MAG: HAD hydrolase-like protein, partial [Spirochaeta sp.]